MSAPPIPRPLLDDLRALPKPFWVLLAGTFINRFGTFVMPFLTIYLYRQGHSLVVASFAVSAFGFGTLCGSTLGGWLADRIGRKHTIAIGAFASSLFYLLLYCAGSMPAIIVCAALAGLGAGTYPPASSALLADVVPEDRRVRAWSALRVALNAGFACGVASAGFLAKISFFWLFAGDALTTALYGCIALAALPHGLRSAEAKAPWPEALRHIRGNRAFHLTFAAALCVALVFSQFGSSYSAHVVMLGLSLDVFGFHLTGETIYGLLLGWNGLLVVLVELPLTGLTLRYDPRRAMALGYFLLGAGFALNAFATRLPFLFLAMTIFTVGEMISSPVNGAYMAQLAPARLRGRYMGVLSLSWCFSSIVGPPVGMRLLAGGHRLGWLLCGVLGVLAAVLALRSEPPEEEPDSGMLPGAARARISPVTVVNALAPP